MVKIVVITDTHSVHLGRFVHVLRKIVSENSSEQIILFHCGDLLQMTRETYFSQGQNVIEPFAEIRKLVSRCFFVPGNNDYYFGESWPIDFCQQTAFECVVTNNELLRSETTTRQYSHKSIVFYDGKVKFAILGLMTPDTQFCFNHPCIAGSSEVIPHQSIIKEIMSLQKKHPDIARYFILSHLGMFETNPTNRYDDIQLAEAICKLGNKNITICGGHVHLPPTRKPKMIGGIAITSGENHLSGYLVFETDSVGSLVPDTGFFTKLSSNELYDEKIAAIDQQFYLLSKRNLRLPGIHLQESFGKEPAFLKVDANDIRDRDTAIANFTADALSQHLMSHVLYPRGAILPPPFQGSKLSTFSDLIEMFNVSNQLVSFYITGEELIQVFCGGLKMRASVLEPSRGIRYCCSQSGEITSVTVWNREIFADQRYYVTTTDWIYGRLINGNVRQTVCNKAVQTGEDKNRVRAEPTVGEYVIAYLLEQNNQEELVQSLLSRDTPCESRVIREKERQACKFFKPNKRKKPELCDVGVQCDSAHIELDRVIKKQEDLSIRSRQR